MYRHKKIIIRFISVSAVFLMLPVIFLIAERFPEFSAAADKFGSISVGCNIKEYKTNNDELSDKNIISADIPLSSGYGEKEETESTSENSEKSGPKPYPSEWNLNSAGEVIKTTYGRFSGVRFFDLESAGQVQNKTSVSNDILIQESTMLPDFKINTSTADPQVLIMHTHTTESFEPYEREKYDTSFNYRTTDSDYNMAMVGNEIENELKKAGISVIHNVTIHDYPSYNGSYERSAATVKGILANYPSVKVVLDIHRDAISDGDNLIAPVVKYEDEEAAQVMIISGCDDGTMDMPDYMQNFRFACNLQSQLELDHPGFTRPVLFDYRKYNQDLTTGSILIEVGSHGNTLAQVKKSGEWIGSSLAECLKNLEENQ